MSHDAVLWSAQDPQGTATAHLRIDYDAALKAYDEHGGRHSEALRAALDAGVRLAVIQRDEAMHAALHRQLQAAAQRSARHIDEQAGILAMLDEDESAELSGTVHVLLDVQRRTVASLGDLLAAVAGEP